MTDIDRQALLAAAASAETWDVKEHGKCYMNYFHCGYWPAAFDPLEEEKSGRTDHG